MFRCSVLLLLLQVVAAAITQSELATLLQKVGMPLAGAPLMDQANLHVKALNLAGASATSMEELWARLNRIGMADANVRPQVCTSAQVVNVDTVDNCRGPLVRLAIHAVAPEVVLELFDIFLSSHPGKYDAGGGMGLEASDAQMKTVDTAIMKADPEQLRFLYLTLRGKFAMWQGNVKINQQMATQLAIAGTDAATLQVGYFAGLQGGNSDDASMAEAQKRAVTANLGGRARRYVYSDSGVLEAKGAQDFQSLFPSTWLAEWNKAPQVKKSWTSGGRTTSYCLNEVFLWIKGTGLATWDSMQEVTQQRLGLDGASYTMAEFAAYDAYRAYSGGWQAIWHMSAELPCKECTAFAMNMVV